MDDIMCYIKNGCCILLLLYIIESKAGLVPVKLYLPMSYRG